jgi:mono/diheme cytochrome c family protein
MGLPSLGRLARIAAGALAGAGSIVAAGAPEVGAQGMAAPSTTGAPRSGRTVFHASCAACHGGDGKGASSSQVGFAYPLPDLTDCRFTAREANLDWLGVVHNGGPARGFSELMPAFGDALSDEEISLAVDYVRTLCRNKSWPRGELNLPRALVTEKAFPEDEVLWVNGVTLKGPVRIDGNLILEKRLGPTTQIEMNLPYGVRRRVPAVEGRTGWGSGVGDISLGAKQVLVHSLESGTILSVAGELILPTGDEADGYSKGTLIFEPFLALGQLFPSVGFLQFQAGAELPWYTHRAGREGYARLVLGRTFTQNRFGRAWTPMFELIAAGEFDNLRALDWDYVPELQVTLSRRRHIRVNVGVRMPMTGIGERPMQALGYLLWDWFDGGIDDGW